MRNQHKFDLVTLRAPKDDPEVGGDFYGLPWPCWGTPEVRHPGSPILYNAGICRHGRRKRFPRALRYRTERRQTLLAEGSYPPGSEIKDGYPEFTYGVLKKLGWDKDLRRRSLRSSRKSPAVPTLSIQFRGLPIFPAESSELPLSMAVHLMAMPRRGRSRGESA